MRTLKNLLLITLPTFLILFFITEIILRKWFPAEDPFERFKIRYDYSYVPSQMPINMKLNLTSNEGLPGIDNKMIYTTNNFGFRGDSLIVTKPANEFRIFIVGGSTTECFYIDDSKSLDRILQNEIQKKYPDKSIKVYGAGKSGDATPQHLAMISQRIAHLQPDMIILFIGINDFMKSIIKYDYRHSKPQRQYTPSYFYLAATDLQIFRRLYFLIKQTNIEELREKLPLNSNYGPRFKLQQQTLPSDSLPHIDTGFYSTNLNSIIGTCKENNIKLAFMTNQSTWNSQVDTAAKNYHWLRTFKNITYKELYLQNGLNTFNNTTRFIAIQKNVPLYDLAKFIPQSLDYFYDDCHFNVAGADFAGKQLSNFIFDKNIIQNKNKTTNQ